jgi:hypothetical protein
VVDSAGSSPAAGTTSPAAAARARSAVPCGHRATAGDHLQVGTAVAVGVVPGDGHVACGVGAPHDRTSVLQRGEQRDVGLPVGVARPHADEHGAGCHGGQEGGRVVAAPVMRHFEDVGTQGHVGGEEIALLGQLRVAGEQDRSRGRGGADDKRAVVDGRAVVRIDDGGRVRRPQHVEGEAGPGQPPTGGQRDKRHAHRGGVPGDIA